ncbi:MAG TPA: hypothetical protein PK006_10880 [Saprospiraceae bacterium]|nr:hypothetical protein [Saprospiraceae bacterium]
MKTVSLFHLCFAFLISCSNVKNPVSLAGKYQAHIEIDKSKLNSAGVKDSIELQLSKAKEELQKIDFKNEMDLSKIDTSTAEGKLEYAAKEFAGSMTNLGKELGSIGLNLGKFLGDVTINGINDLELGLHDLKFDVELQEDGDIKTDQEWIAWMYLKNVSWEQSNDQFILKNKDGVLRTFKFTTKDDGFILEENAMKVVLTKINSSKKI